MHDDVTQVIALLHDFVIGGGNHAGLEGDNGDVANIGQRIVVELPVLFGSANPGFNRLGDQGRLQSQLDGADRLSLDQRQITLGRQPVAGGGRRDQGLGDLMANLIRWHNIRMAPREDRAVQEGGDETDREVGDDAIEGFLRLVHGVPYRPGEPTAFRGA